MDSTNLKTAWHHYYTLSMLLICGSVALIVLLNVETVWRNFETNVAINSVIWSIILVAVAICFYNNKKLRDTVFFLKKIEETEQQDHITEQDINHLKKMMKTRGRLLDMANMNSVLDRIDDMGYAQFNDTDARLVKSKFGYRVRNDRGVVSFLAGMLVMLGLIGTFWGLLITIDSVGNAMVKVSDSFGSGNQDISGFLSSISEPLSGMGLAFSSSLFGLAGSLFLGFLNFFAGKTQNNIIEMFSRWADDHIPAMNHALKKKTDNSKTPSGDDLKSWLAGYVYLSTKMNKQVQTLTQVVGRSAKASYINSRMITDAMSKQKDYQENLNQMTSLLASIDSKLEAGAAAERDQQVTDLLTSIDRKLEGSAAAEQDRRKSATAAAQAMENLGALLQDIKTQTKEESFEHAQNMQHYDVLQKELATVLFSIQNQVTNMQTLINQPENYDVYDVMEEAAKKRAESDNPDE